MYSVFSKASLLAVAAMGLLVAGCASKDDLARAQGQADRAQSAADQASQSAQAAQKSADEDRSEINSLNQKMEEIENSHRGGERG